jgi:hypothetical protein
VDWNGWNRYVVANFRFVRGAKKLNSKQKRLQIANYVLEKSMENIYASIGQNTLIRNQWFYRQISQVS